MRLFKFAVATFAIASLFVAAGCGDGAGETDNTPAVSTTANPDAEPSGETKIANYSVKGMEPGMDSANQLVAELEKIKGVVEAMSQQGSAQVTYDPARFDPVVHVKNAPFEMTLEE